MNIHQDIDPYQEENWGQPKWNKIKKENSSGINIIDLPRYGKYVLVYGTDKKCYGVKQYHVCAMDDLEDGLDFKKTGEFFWLTENGTRIEDVTHWMELPDKP